MSKRQQTGARHSSTLRKHPAKAVMGDGQSAAAGVSRCFQCQGRLAADADVRSWRLRLSSSEKAAVAASGVSNTPERIQTDRGLEFFAEAVQRRLMEWGIKFRPTKPRSPHLNGKVDSQAWLADGCAVSLIIRPPDCASCWLEQFVPTVSQSVRASLALPAARSSNVAQLGTAARSSASVGAISCCWEKSSSRVEREHLIVVPK
jgi:hypothetical protein